MTGPSGASIFLPAAGSYYGTSLGDVGEAGKYWTSTPHASYIKRSYQLSFDVFKLSIDWYYRSCGASVRAVKD